MLAYCRARASSKRWCGSSSAPSHEGFATASVTVENDHDGLLASESYGANPFIPSVWRRILEIVANAYFFVALALGLLAVPTFLGRRRPWRLFFLLAGAALAVQPLIFFGDPRFHVPVLPFVAVLAAVLLARTPTLFAARSDRPVTQTSRA